MENSLLHTIRHSASHLLAAAVQELFAGVKLGIGPSTEEGFYYDFDSPHTFTEEDLVKIEEKMKELVKKNVPFIQSAMSKQQAQELFSAKGELYKCELIHEIPDAEVSLFTTGTFMDLCKGPHVQSTREVAAFKLLSVAGAYWRGNEKNKMLQRIYGTAFPTKQELDAYIFRIEEAKKRDHRVVGKKLELFSFHEEAPGVPFYHPKGLVIYNALIDYWREEHEKEGYVEIRTPIILREELWKQSGHYDHYKEHMYFTKIEDIQYAVKPMNCPGGLLIYKSRQHSYREFPIKMAELGLVHRHELSGVLHGLFRVKSFTIDDAHIFCLEEQIAEEVSRAISLVLRIYKTFSFTDVHLELSTRPQKSMGSDEMWAKATEGLREALKRNGIQYKVNEGDGAFYGPKIDFHIKDSIGRSWQCGTVQLDFSMPERFELEYIGSDGAVHRPVMVHRAAFGSIERFLGILIEHYGGVFPLWLAPLQVRVMSISDKAEAYAREVYEYFFSQGIRCDLDTRSEKISYKIREAESMRINYMMVVGEKEAQDKTVSVRAHGKKDLGVQKLSACADMMQNEIKTRA